MEQESEGMQAMALEFDNKVRMEARMGFQQMRNIEHWLRIAPHVILGKADEDDAQILRCIVVKASTAIVGRFSKIISLLSAPPNSNSSSTLGRITVCNAEVGNQDLIGQAESTLSSCHTKYDRTGTPQSPSGFGPAANLSANLMIDCTTSPACSPCHTPHSESGMSEGSPPNPSHLNLDMDGEAAATAPLTTITKLPRQFAKEASTRADPELSEQQALCRKRKFMPKYSCKQPASGADPGNEGPPNDGYTWRKYGQKDILGSRFPRSYYRCTHKMELGCLAIKYVQRSDEEPSMFDVTYRGHHTCQFSMHQQAWHFALPPEQALKQRPISDPSSSPATLNFPHLGGNPMNNAPAAAQTCVVTSDQYNVRDGRSGFPQLTGGSPMTGIPPIPDMSTSPVMASRFGLNPHSMELDRRFSVKPEGSNPSGQPAHTVCQSPRDLFGPNSAVMNLLRAAPRPALDQRHVTCLDDPPQRGGCNNLEHARDLARTAGSTNGGPMDKLFEVQYNVVWGQDNTSDSVQLDAQGTYRYNNYTPIFSNTESLRCSPNIHTASTERGHLVPVKDASDPTSAAPLPMGFVESSLGITDYEPINDIPLFTCN